MVVREIFRFLFLKNMLLAMHMLCLAMLCFFFMTTPNFFFRKGLLYIVKKFFSQKKNQPKLIWLKKKKIGYANKSRTKNSADNLFFWRN
jgi:hypothetical protein